MQPTPSGAPPGGAVDPGKAKNLKLARGCGGCGCVFALLCLLGGAVLIGFGTQRATREAMPFGIITTGVSVPVAIVSAIILFWAISSLKKLQG